MKYLGTISNGKDLVTKEYVDGRSGVTGVKGNSESSYRTGNVDLTAANVGAVSKSGDTMTGNLIVPATRIANTFYGITFGRTTGTPVETILYTGIKWGSGWHMPVIHITGYAFGLQSPVEFKIGFYIYADKIGYCGVVNMGSWSPNVYLFKYTNSGVDYVAVGLAGSCYFLQLSADVQDEMGKFAKIVTDSSAWTWSFLTTAGTIPTPDSGVTCIQVPYKANILKPANAVLADKATGDKNGNDITTTYTPLSSGFGRALSGVSKSNWNTIDNTVAFYATSTATSKPTGTDHCGLQIAYGSTWKYQLAFDYRTDTIYTRACENGTWHDWYPIYTSAKTIPISNGGTGGTTAAAARTNLGLGTAAVAGLGTANGAASLGSDGKVPSSQLPTIPTVPSATNSATTGISIAAHSTGTVTGVQSSTTTASKVTVGSHSTDYGVKSAGSGSFTSGAFSGGSGSFGATVTNHVLSFSHTHTAATHGADSHTHTAPTLGSKVPTVSASDVTVPIKNTSASTFVTGTSHTVTDNGHTHTLS